MRKLFKYQVPGSPGDTVKVETVHGSTFRHFGMQAGRFFVWAEHDAALERERYEPHVFCVHGTGWEISEDAAYVGTTQDGQFVWHLFEMGH
jgi:hypothetical protein